MMVDHGMVKVCKLFHSRPLTRSQHGKSVIWLKCEVGYDGGSQHGDLISQSSVATWEFGYMGQRG
ncbi:hypothetical protein HanIR_Chr04g0160551 [Helianthus annuus]|nr:hypothetical protein HanIR_Chr04g0160551 [Helianthus annuus]